MRDGLDVMNAIYYHIKNYYNPKAEFKDILKRHLKNWTDYHTKWLKNENNLDILYLNYEDIIADKEAVVKQIAKFIEFDLTDEILARVLERSSFDFMKKHESKEEKQETFKYKCNACNYYTNDKNDLIKHNATQKHLNNVNGVKKEKIYKCPDCNYITKDSSNFSKHKKTQFTFRFNKYNVQDCY